MLIPALVQTLVPITAPNLMAAPNIDDPAFKDAVLTTHNTARAKHGVAGLAWDNTVAQYAQNWANNCTWGHSVGSPYGENMYGSSGVSDYLASSKSGIDNWYNEIAVYNFSTPGYQKGTGHFTQVVWKASTKVGCGWNQGPCTRDGNPFYIYVCSYSPKGNVDSPGYFEANVPRPLSAVEGGGDGDGLVLQDGEEARYIVVELK